MTKLNVALATATAVAAGGALAPAALAGSHSYCGAPNLVQSGSGCWSGLGQQYDINQVTYSGSGSFTFCERLYVESGGITYSIQCRSSPGTKSGLSNDTGNAPYPNNNTSMRDQVENYDNNQHTLTGFSQW